MKLNKHRAYKMARAKLINIKYNGRSVPDNLDLIEPSIARYLEDPDVREIIERKLNEK